MKANRYMGGRFEPARAGADGAGGSADGVSNPVEFLVPRVMETMLEEEA
jgi:hypothetical protein